MWIFFDCKNETIFKKKCKPKKTICKYPATMQIGYLFLSFLSWFFTTGLHDFFSAGEFDFTDDTALGVLGKLRSKNPHM